MHRHAARIQDSHAPQARRSDRWSVMALAMEREQQDVTATSPQGTARALAERKTSVEEAVLRYNAWTQDERVEFAESLSASGDAPLKHSVAIALGRSLPGAIDPHVSGLLSFQPVADDIALSHIETRGRSANNIASELAAAYPDSALRSVLAASFEAAAGMCEDKSSRKNLARVAGLLRDGHA